MLAPRGESAGVAAVLGRLMLVMMTLVLPAVVLARLLLVMMILAPPLLLLPAGCRHERRKR